jgi:hypothetical protein
VPTFRRRPQQKSLKKCQPTGARSFCPPTKTGWVRLFLAYGLIKNHPFIDGNKRIGAHVMLTVLALNGIELEYTQEELSETILQVAAGEKTFEALLAWVLNPEA